MATVIGVGMQMTANAAGMTKGLSDADKALQLLQKIVEQNQQSLKRFTGEADKTTQQLDKLTKGVSTLSTIEIGRVLVDTFQALGSAFTSAAQNVLTLAGNVANSLDSLNDLSARTGIGVEALQGYALAAKFAGVDTEAFGVAVQKLAVNIGKATPGGEMDKALRGINLSVAELRMLAPEQQFSVIGEAIAGLPTVAERAAVAVQVFGKQGAALAPLFREGAASIEELRDRAERLGVIVSEAQLNNIGAMNDGFDLVKATIEGIIGQVVGNLAPAVTDVTNQFLKFVEEWSGAQGEGGTGIANRITEVLLQGAEYFAGVFDRFVGDFRGFTDGLQSAADVFGFVANVFTAVSESFRQVFNLLQISFDGWSLALAKTIEAIGSWVSDDLEEYGAKLADSASARIAKNQREFLEAGANSFQAGLDAVGLGEGTTTAAERGKGAATAYVESFRQQVEASQQPEIKVATNLETTEERLKQFLTTATDGGSEFLRQSVETLDTFQRMTAEGGLTADQIKIMQGFMENVNAELNKEVSLRKEAADAAAQQSAADDKRIEGLLKTSDASSKLQDDLDAVERRIKEVQASSDADAQARLGQLTTLRDSLKEQQQALSQGFGKGFEDAFTGADEAVKKAIENAKEFGAAGSQAAQGLIEGIAAAKELVKDGLTKEAFDIEVARQQEFFNQRVEQEKVVAAEREAAAQRVEAFLRQGIDARQRAELDAAKQLEERKKQAAQNVAAIEAKLDEERRKNVEDREKGRIREARAGAERIKQLEQAQRAEQNIIAGRADTAIKEQQKLAAAANTRAEQFQSIISRQNDLFLKSANNLYAGANEALARQSQVYQEMVRRSQPSTAPLQVGDVRTQEGANLVLDLAANAQDPALIEQRLQTKFLRILAENISGVLGRPVGILGGVG